ncbi:MAG: long-chain fatty acid--CoA ligase [Chitinophagaceae bacterium]|jgi:long-chain acyl-CoA synthetase|nr:long-chain fatty acid--CoA ligase [Chitinophagaceae bacterium]MBP6047247.1 long-chain fatty acid--CoA ligase [Ferruginibacter sp.]MBK7345916.1 long-chain fatty acid--CoA ligase [Chitinophagaceae bacterium]MBP6371999.1 long-chain fatty acid--CoA ligase [Ferruginibacter sp.]MBP6988233.1 long-chain fatty acid--CoA ligase [Ferruginibacter sp.]
MNEVTRLFDFFYFQLKNFPKADMLTSKVNGKWAPLSTQDVSGLVNRLSAGLMKLGLSGNDMTVENQDKVALISRNRPEWLILDLACQQIGIALCPIYPTTNPLELEFIFNDAAVKYVFLSGEDILEKVNNVQHQTPSLKEVYSFDDDGIATSWKSLLENISQEDLEKVEKLKQEILPSHCATIIYTSGTTGKPKGVMLSHNNIVSNVMNSVESFPFPLHTHAKALSFLPLNHIFERMVSYIYFNSGISIYYADSLETIGEDLKDIKPQLFCTVPRLLEKVYEKIMLKGAELTGIKKKLFYWAIELGNKYDSINKGNMSYRLQLAIANKLIFSKWREALGNNIEFIITGGAACQVRLLRVFTAAKIPIYEGYGPTENSPVISVNTRKQVKFGTVGPVLKGQQVKLEPDGEICVKGPSVMQGYYKRPDLTAETIINGWLHTGDIGVMEDGIFLKITDRKKELFKTSGGKYVAPQPIENKMKESAFIEQMMVVGADRKFVGALIVPSLPNLKEWMQLKGISFTTVTDAVNHPKVLELYKEIVESFNQYFNNVEQVKKFELLPEEWTIDTGELTPTLKLKRRVIMEKFKSAVDRIYV